METPKDMAIREIQEELSIVLDPARLTLVQKHYISEQNLTTWVFHYPISGEFANVVLREGQAWDVIHKDGPRVSEIGLHHREIVLDYWAKPY
jgi:hypothetical protein